MPFKFNRVLEDLIVFAIGVLLASLGLFATVLLSDWSLFCLTLGFALLGLSVTDFWLVLTKSDLSSK